MDAASTIMLLLAIEAMYPGTRLIHVFLDHAGDTITRNLGAGLVGTVGVPN